MKPQNFKCLGNVAYLFMEEWLLEASSILKYVCMKLKMFLSCLF